MSAMNRGMLTGAIAYVSWGFFPLYLKLLAPASPGEILAHRILWSAVFMAVLLTVLRRHRAVAELVRDRRRLAAVGLPALLIGANWFTFIAGVTTSHVVEVSLGYFITPLVNVLLGVFVLGERLRRAQWTAVGVGAVAVAALAAEYGRPPWLALVVAVSFSLYGLVKKRQALPAAEGLLVETAALLPLAMVYIVYLMVNGKATVGQGSAAHTLLMLLAGALTALPFMSFAFATSRLPLTTLGILQYSTPIMHLGLGVLVFHEPMPAAQLAAFVLIWLALAIFIWNGLRSRDLPRPEEVARKWHAEPCLSGRRHHTPERRRRHIPVPTIESCR